MAHLIIDREICNKDVFVPGQILAIGSFVLQADPTGRLGQIGSFAPVQGIRFGTLEFIADSRGELVLIGPSTLMEEPADPDASTPKTSGPASDDEVVIPGPS